ILLSITAGGSPVGSGHRVYTLEGSALPYSTLVEKMQQGAAILDARGCIVYCNLSLAQLLGVARETVIGRLLLDFVASEDQPAPAAARYAAVWLSTRRRNPASGITNFRNATIHQKFW